MIVEKTFVCLKALHPRRNLYYEFNWDEFHTSALAATSAPEPGPSTSALPDASIWERTDQWDVFPDETPFTPKKPKRPSGYTYVRGTRAGREGSDDEDDLLPAIREEDEDHVSSPASPSKRKRGIHAASAGRRGKRARHENDQDVSSSEDEGDASENYEHDLAQNDEAEDDHILDADAVLSGDDASLTPSDAESDMIYPRTPSKRNKRAAALRTPSKRRGPARAAPTPHSKAALRARANRTRTRQLAVRPPPGPGAALDDEFDLASVGDDPWLRAMHVLHVAARPEGTGSRLPCRDAEYTRVLGAVEELIEEGSGGCVCACFSLSLTSSLTIFARQTSRACRARARQRRCTRWCASCSARRRAARPRRSRSSRSTACASPSPPPRTRCSGRPSPGTTRGARATCA